METERLIIDDLRETDKEDYFDNISHDRKVLATFICRYEERLENFDFSRYLGREDLFAIRLKETGRLIGILTCFRQGGDTCEIGYGLGSRYWGRGYATEAAKRFVDYCLYEKGYNAVYASHFTGNDASRRVMEKCGMTYDRMEKNELEYRGVWRDLAYYVIRKS